MLEDKVLVQKFKSGDITALERIYEKYKNDLLALAIFLINDIAAAEDAIHDVFVNFAQSVAKPNKIKNLKSICPSFIWMLYEAEPMRELYGNRGFRTGSTVGISQASRYRRNMKGCRYRRFIDL